MTPHLLLLTSAEEVGGPLMIPIANIAYMAPLGHLTTRIGSSDLGTRIFLVDRAEFIDVTEKFDAIIACMGGLVMKPWPAAQR